ncbi:hypothetical protein JHK82_056483 [Glycine max]|nr:hypothetical protein JHK86_056316 [Glycine max]KAG4919042.1 hypothetical protein JHK85_057323 [Glycine max]KAG5077788.1 hypothetical protein JHK82_056483 [Glycine max]
MEKTAVKVRCQRIGCDAMFSEADNPDGSCRYHDSVVKIESIPRTLKVSESGRESTHALPTGCKTGKHTTVKQVITPVKKNTMPSPTAVSSTNASSKESCPRCRQGFFCSNHGSQSKPVNVVGDKAANLAGDVSADNNSSVEAPKPKKIVDINEAQVCKNKGCGQTFKEKDNHDTACNYHPGPAVFHDRMRGWKCCDIHVKEFDEFMSIPPCAKGWHNADPES